MIGQKQYSLRDKQAGKKPEDVRVAESKEVVSKRLALTSGAKKKKKGGTGSRTGSKIKSNKGKNK